MPPRFLESGFDQTVAQYEGIGRDNTNDFVTLLNDMVTNYDFSKVDSDAAYQLVSTIAQKYKKLGWQKAEEAVKIGLDWVATMVEGGSAATGQWYITAATFLSKQLLDYAEVRFDTYMGWDTGDVFKRGDWVAINMGHEPTKIMDVDRRRLGLDDPETALALIHSDPIVSGFLSANSQQEAWEFLQETEATYQQFVESVEPLRRMVHLGIATGQTMESTSNKFVEVLDLQTGQETYQPQQNVIKIPAKEAARLDADPRLSKIKRMYENPDVHAPDQIDARTSMRVGDNVVFMGELYEILEVGLDNGRKMRLSDGKGTLVDVYIDDSDLGPAHSKTSYKPNPNSFENFVTLGGYNSGDYVWIQGQYGMWELNCISSIKGDSVEVYDARTGEPGTAHIGMLRPAKREVYSGGYWAKFADAVVECDRLAAKAYAPGKSWPRDCVARTNETHKFDNPPLSQFASIAGGGEDQPNLHHVETADGAIAKDKGDDFMKKLGLENPDIVIHEGEEFPPYGKAAKGTDFSALFVIVGLAVAAYAITR